MLALSGKLLRFDQVPDIFKEVGIMGGYRHPQSSAKQCLLSMLDSTNETINFWTHFLGFMYFAYWFISIFALDYSIHDDIRIPLGILLFTSALYPLGSAIAHAFNTMSIRARHICFFLDYWGISLYSFGSSISYASYSFHGDFRSSSFHTFYTPMAFTTCVSCVAILCFTRFLEKSPLRVALRAGPFVFLYLFNMIPVWRRLFYDQENFWLEEGLWYHVLGTIWAAASLLMYVSHFPEKYFPGRFDVFGHSHQFFHVFAVWATKNHIYAAVSDMLDVEAMSGNINSFPSGNPVHWVIAHCVLCVLIILAFTAKLPTVAINSSTSCNGKHLKSK